jgi:hypothetical protein
VALPGGNPVTRRIGLPGHDWPLAIGAMLLMSAASDAPISDRREKPLLAAI